MKIIQVNPENWVQSRGYHKQLLADAQTLASQGTLVQLVVMEPGEVIPPHYHRQSTEFYYVIQGHCRLEVRGACHRLGPGEMVLIHPKNEHTLHNDGELPFKLLVFKTNAPESDTYWSGDPG